MIAIVPLTPALLAHWPDAWPGERAALLGRIRWHLHTPGAVALAAVHAGAVQGFGTAVPQGTSAWITALRWVHEAPPAHADPLLAALCDAAARAGCAAVHLIAPPVHLPALERMGFVSIGAVQHWSGGTVEAASDAHVVPLDATHRLAALHLHAQALGTVEGLLLHEHTHLAHVWAEQARVRGLYLPTLGAGLIVAQAPHIGAELQRWHLAHHPGLLLPADNTAACAHLRALGHTPFAEGVWMCRGAHTPLRLPWLHALPWGCAWGGE